MKASRRHVGKYSGPSIDVFFTEILKIPDRTRVLKPQQRKPKYIAQILLLRENTRYHMRIKFTSTEVNGQRPLFFGETKAFTEKVLYKKTRVI